MQTHPKIATLLRRLTQQYPSLAKEVIQEYQDMSVPANRSFFQHPDDPSEHTPHWHQHGVITHSRRFLQSLQTDVPKYLKLWGVELTVQKTMLVQVDGIAKADLLLVTALLHDIGKFAARRPGKGFLGHEELSGKLIRTNLRSILAEFLSPAQIEYTARTAELHYELGKLRHEAKQHGYTLAFTKSRVFQQAALKLQADYPDFAIEIGLLFLPDSLSKVDIFATGTTDKAIAAEKDALAARLREASIPLELLNGALQMPVNIAMAGEYLKLLSGHSAKRILWLALDSESRAKLKALCRPKYAEEFYHHVTLAVDPAQTVIDTHAGAKHEVTLVAHAYNDRVQAVRIQPTGLPDTYGVPHITLSAQPGVEPFESVPMLLGEHHEEKLRPMQLSGMVESRVI